MHKISYITDMSLPSNKAQSIHVFKMIESLLNHTNKIELYTPYSNPNYTVKKIKKDYLIRSRKLFNIKSIFVKRSFLNSRIIFGLKVALLIKNQKNQLIITRSFFASFFMIIFNINHFLEIHQALKGLTKLLFINLNFINSNNIIKVIFISNGLSKYYGFKKINYTILSDCYSPKDFKTRKLRNTIKKIYYFGSFYKGRGVELIKEIATLLPKVTFYLYGRRTEMISGFPKNVNIYSIIKYSSISKVIRKADLLLMPYQFKISINSNDYKDDISKFISPLKMFEYLGTGIPIISSELKVLKEVLIHKKNAYLVKNYHQPLSWKKAIENLANNNELRSKISKSAIKTAKLYTWDLRVRKIIKLYNEKNI